MSDDPKLGKTAMSAASRYWRAIAIDAAGGRKIDEIAPAKAFFLASFPEFTVRSEVPDTLVQRQLVHWMREDTPLTISEQNCQEVDIHEPLNHDSNTRFLAQLCLKCFISSQIERVCQRLANQFGEPHGFTCDDLLPFVLDSDCRQYTGEAKPQHSTSYQSLADQILQSFDPEQSNLANWTSRRVKHHKELNSFLLEHGVYLVSDWAILNDTTPKQLERIFSQFHQLARVEIEEGKQLLERYHAVYRTQRLKQRQAGTKSLCSPPTPEQLHQINPMLSPTIVLAKLQKMASRLREYRIYVRGGSVAKETTDPTILADTLPYNSADTIDDQTEFLQVYQQEFVSCLDRAITQVTHGRVTQLQNKDRQKSQQFIKALQLFHCQELSMTEIARLVGLKAQFQVSRLLKLKAFRADIQRELLVLLRDRIFAQAKLYANPQRLQTCYQQIEDALNEQITIVIQEPEIEASTATIKRNKTPSSLFTQRVCHYLDRRNNLP